MHPDDIKALLVITGGIIALIIVIKTMKATAKVTQDTVVPFVKDKSNSIIKDHNETKMLKAKELFDNNLISQDEYNNRIDKLKGK